MATQKKTKSTGTRARKNAATGDTGAAANRTGRDKVQGEGDYASAREFNEDQRTFVENHDTDELGRNAAPNNAGEAAELDAAERKGKARARPDPEADEETRRPDDFERDDERDRS